SRHLEIGTVIQLPYLFNVAVICVFFSIIVRGIHTNTAVLVGTLFILGYRIKCVSKISTWQSWDLRFVNFFSAKFKIPFILDEYLDGTLILLKQSNMVSFSSLLIV